MPTFISNFDNFDSDNLTCIVQGLGEPSCAGYSPSTQYSGNNPMNPKLEDPNDSIFTSRFFSGHVYPPEDADIFSMILDVNGGSGVVSLSNSVNIYSSHNIDWEGGNYVLPQNATHVSLDVVSADLGVNGNPIIFSMNVNEGGDHSTLDLLSDVDINNGKTLSFSLSDMGVSAGDTINSSSFLMIGAHGYDIHFDRLYFSSVSVTEPSVLSIIFILGLMGLSGFRKFFKVKKQ